MFSKLRNYHLKSIRTMKIFYGIFWCLIVQLSSQVISFDANNFRGKSVLSYKSTIAVMQKNLVKATGFKNRVRVVMQRFL